MKRTLIYIFLMWCSISISWGQGTVQENDWLTIYQLGMKYKDTSNNKKALQLSTKTVWKQTLFLSLKAMRN